MSGILNLIPVIEPIMVGIMQWMRPESAIRCYDVIENVVSVCEYIPA